ncbi:MAG: alpha/beta fold hydrolase [Streptosporangiales bacterium]|nr:alpha/beta fold hydrolase [Streptosporangiales bacterium]
MLTARAAGEHAGGCAGRSAVVGWLCSIGPAAGKTLQLLVPGYTYDHSYWDFGHRPDRYSYIRSATRAGYATFSFDRLGAGRSSRPPALQVDVPTHAWTVHQLVTSLRAGRFGGSAFDKIALVGHSMGAAIAQVEASTYRDVDAVVLSDWLHTPLWRGTPQVPISSIPAQHDARFTDTPLGYVTTAPGTRRLIFYSGNVEDEVVAHDEATKQTGTLGEEHSVVPTVLPHVTRGIRAPVLLATGEHDALFCGPVSPCTDAATVRSREVGFFSSQACLTTYVLPGAGHNINLHRNSRDWLGEASRWIDAVLGKRATTPSPGCAGIRAGAGE